MPLHLLQQQLGHTKIDMTMRYARFHPIDGDVAAYFERVGEQLGFHDGNRPDEEVARKAAELFGVAVEMLREALKGAATGNDSGNGAKPDGEHLTA